MTDFQRVAAGDPLRIRARDWNALGDMLRNQATSRTPLPTGQSLRDVVYARNDSGAALASWQVAGVSGVAFVPADQGDSFGRPLLLTLTTPTVADHAQRFVVAIEPIADGAVGRVVLSGVTVAQVSNTAGIESPTHATLAGEGSGAAVLEAGTSGPVEIIWIDSGSGASGLAAIRFGSVGSAVTRLIVKEVFNDYMRCRTWDGTTEGDADVYVAKVESLRHDLTLLQTYYSSVTEFTTTDSENIGVNGGGGGSGEGEDWRVNPVHAVGVEIYAEPQETGLTTEGSAGEPIAYIDTNRAGRAWARVVIEGS